MSYCRWSTNNSKCDLYCYEGSDGFHTHIASYRIRTWVRVLYFLTDHRVDLGLDHKTRFHRTWVRYLIDTLPDHWHRYRIRLKYAGQSFLDDTEEEMFNRVCELQVIGYHAPNIWE